MILGNETEANFELIQAVRERPVLWDTTLDVTERTTSLKRGLWMEVARIIPAGEVMRKLTEKVVGK